MNSVTLHRHKVNYYLAPFLVAVFCFVPATLMLLYFIDSLREEGVQVITFFPLIFSGVLYFLLFYAIKINYQQVPKIKADRFQISFNKEVFEWNDVQKVELTGKQPYKVIEVIPMEATTIYLKSGEKKWIFDSMYENAWELKQFIRSQILKQEGFANSEFKQISASELKSETYTTYKGNAILSFDGILLWGMIVFLLLMGLIAPHTVFRIIIVFVGLLFFFLISRMMHYFKVSKSFLIVKNHNFFWIKKAYRLTDILEVVHELPSQYRKSDSLLVITKDLKSRLYMAGTLRIKTWEALKEHLESQNVKVRRDLY